MRFGACIGDDVTKIKFCEDIGFDYLETGFAMLGKGNEEKYDAFLAEILKNNIRCESANCFIPGSLKTTGENVDLEALAEYVEYGMSRGPAIGLKTVVFGSGGSKEVPEGFSHAKAFHQLAVFLREVCSPIASKYGITVVVEPLCDCNIIRTVREGAYLAGAADRENIKGLGDLFHMYNMGDTNEDIRAMKGVIGHAHIAEPVSRHYPTDPDKYDYKSFIDALEYAGCPRCSVEAGTDDFFREAPEALAVLKACSE